MDDILTDQKRGTAEDKLNDINQLHENLQCTMEREKDGEIPFLDMKVKKEKCKLSSTWYTKPTDTGLMLNFHAMAPKKYKRSVVSGIVHRIYRSCSSWTNMHESLNRAKQMLSKNQYPEDFYEPIIHQTLTKLLSPPESEDGEEKQSEIGSEELGDGHSGASSDDSDQCDVNIDRKELFKFFIQYRGKCTEHFARALHNLKAPCVMIMTLRKLKTVMPSLKPRVEMEFRSGVVYKIVCPRCHVSYVGETTRHLLTRHTEHKNNHGPVKTHFSSCGLSLTWDDISILSSTFKSEDQLRTLEALYIREHSPVLNTQETKSYKAKTLKIKF